MKLSELQALLAGTAKRSLIAQQKVHFFADGMTCDING